MIDIKELKSEILIEEKFCKKFGKLQRYPMSEELNKLMIVLFLIKDENNYPSEIKKEFLYQVISKRLESCFTFLISDWRLILFLMFLSETPGTAVMYLTFLQYWCKQHKVKEIDLNIFSEKIFPMGFPSGDDLHKLWSECKVNAQPDNLLDYQSAMKSIQFK